MAITPANWSTRKQIRTLPDKVSGSSAHSNFPVLIKDGNIPSEIYEAIDLGTHSLGLVAASSQYAYISDASQTGLDITGDLTIEAWVKTDSLVNTAIATKWGVGGRRAYYFAITTTGLTFGCSNNNTSATEKTVSYSLPIGVWVHVAVTYDASAGSCQFYINGATYGSAQTGLFTSIANGSESFAVGAVNVDSTPTYFANGKLKNVRIFSDIRTATEIIEGMNSALITDANLEGEWQLNNSYADTSGNGNTLTASGSPSFSTVTPLATGQLRFTTDVSGSTEVASEIVSAEKSGSSYSAEVWVKLPSLSHNTSTPLYIWAGNTSAGYYAPNDTYGSQAVWQDYILVHHYFHGANDSSPGGNNGVVSGAIPVDGVIGGGYQFDGVDDYIEVSHKSNQLLTSGFTLDAWIKPDTLGESNSAKIIDKSSGTISENGYTLGQNTTDRITGWVNGSVVGSGSNSLTPDGSTWFKVSVTVSSGALANFFINGVLTFTPDQSLNALSGITTTNALRIGNRSGATDRSYDGVISGVRIRPSVVTESWLDTEYNNQNDPSTFWEEVRDTGNFFRFF